MDGSVQYSSGSTCLRTKSRKIDGILTHATIEDDMADAFGEHWVFVSATIEE